MKRILTALLLSCFLAGAATAQTRTLTLEDCLEIAVETNIQVRQADNSVSLSELTYVQRKFDFLPSVSASASVNKSFGRTVDNFTQAIAQSPVTGSPNIGASLALFRGFSKWNELKKSHEELQAAAYSREDLKNDIRLNVATAFFQATFSRDNLRIARERTELLRKQLERAEAEYKAGTKTLGDVYSVKSQLATEEVNLVNSTNAWRRDLLSLILALNLDPRAEYTLVRPDIEGFADAAELFSAEAIYEYARLNNPGIREKEMRILAGEYAMKSARSVFLPSLNLAYGMGSFYSNNDRPVVGIEEVDGQVQPIYGSPRPFFDQLNRNFGQNLSLSLNIPVFSNYSLRQSYLSSKINYRNAQLDFENEENELYKSIVQARQDVDAAAAQLEATETQQTHLTESFKYARSKYDAGLMDFYTFMEILNNKTRAETDLIRAQYDYVLKCKILDLYQGKPLSF